MYIHSSVYMAPPALPTKERIVAAGSKLFYAEGAWFKSG